MEGEELLKEFQKGGLINQDLAAKLKRESYLSGRSVEELIYERRLVDDKKIANLKSRLLKVPYQKINFDAFDENIL